MKYYKHIKQKLTTLLLLLCSLIVFPTNNFGQKNNDQLFNKLIEEDSSYIGAIVLYPDSTRDAIFTASMHPEILVRLDEMTNKSREHFNSTITPFNQETQSQIWELSRHPELINELTKNGKLSKKEIEYVTYGYPDNIQNAALNISTKQYETLVEINRINESFKRAFVHLISSYPLDVQKAYRTLLNHPEVLEILSDNLRETILVGDAYKNNPKNVKQKADSMSLEIARKNAQELAEWENDLKKDTLAMLEFIASAEDYAKENGYQESDYSSPISNTTVVVHQYPYPYWFGYPSWYTYSYWYPHPWWYEWGFYYGVRGEIVFISLPSYHFTYWFFNDYHHHYYHPHFTNRCINHYYGHRSSYTGMNRAVVHWKNENRTILRERWLSNETNRVNRIKEYGKLEIERARYNSANPDKRISKENYYDIHASNYPSLKPYSSITRKIERPVQKAPNKYYTPKPQTVKPKKPPGKKPLNQNFPYKTYPTKPNQPISPTRDHEKARNYHNENWKKQPYKPPTRPTVKQPTRPAVKQPVRPTIKHPVKPITKPKVSPKVTPRTKRK